MAALSLAIAPDAKAADDWIWIEGEKPDRSDVHRHPWWYDQVKKGLFSGGDFTSNFDEKHVGTLSYRVAAPKAGRYELWVRANPIQSRLSCRVNGSDWGPIEMGTGVIDSTNVAADDKPDLRFLAWARAGVVALKAGANTVEFRMDSANHNHGYLDCFVLSLAPFRPNGLRKPGQTTEAVAGWFAFDPPPDPFAPGAGFDLRGLNEKAAGDGGYIAAKGGGFVHGKTGAPVRFWGVNGPAEAAGSFPEQARMLAKHGVNLVRLHRGYFDQEGNLDPAQLGVARSVVVAMKGEGIYTHLSIYFPLMLKPTAANRALRGYDGTKHPFAAIFFDPGFQEMYRGWWKALLTTPDPATGARLIDDPAVMGLELVNEDSYLFWTFNDQNLPEPERRLLEAQFGEWLARRYGTINAALKAWGGTKVDRDRPAEGRIGFRPLWNLANERTARDKDTARFLVESQRRFYDESARFLRDLGFKGVITASNWATADPRVLGPLEKYSYTGGDFIDRHGYFGASQAGEASEWSIRDGHTYADRSALRFDASKPGMPKEFVHPAMDPSYDGKPSMISETTWNRPNRFRTEAPLYLAAYGALQDSDAIVHFALDGARWSTKPQFFMQPWTLMSPTMMGQFPASALIFRRGLVAPGDLMVDLPLRKSDLFDLKGTPMPQDAALDELRLKDVPAGVTLKPGNVIDPLAHYVGRTAVRFVDGAEPAKLKDLSAYVDRGRKRVASSHGQLRLDYGQGVLTIDAPSAQGVLGNLGSAGSVRTKDLAITSKLDLMAVVAVALDDMPLATSRKILLQVMTEEKASGFRTSPGASGAKTIASIGQDPWLVRQVEGTVRLNRPDAASLKVTRLDPNGEPSGSHGVASEIRLDPATLYYLIAP
ncbi:hypothetical protein TA3x_003245 [Tundrisphaera sp. TA3]|uniref:hypothetical protein n=1 Tax=Tundrisphaera sp. TA3 TaxID=3435775 RepID=UPI003EBF1335